MKKSLFNDADLEEIRKRLLLLSENSSPKWGKMNAGQAMRHCDKILQVGIGKVILPKKNFVIKCIGIITKREMKILNNGIPPNMPTFKEVIVKENCNFGKSRKELMETLSEFVAMGQKNGLLSQHPLFGEMEKSDWGFLEYKHLNHHLKQFGV